jgi:VWFA-related protein
MLALRCSAALILSFAFPCHPQQTSQGTGSSQQSNQPASGSAPRLIPRSAQDRNRAARDSHDIVLNVLVTDASGNPVSGLAEKDFTLLDDGQPQPITYFHPAQPAHVILLLDPVNSSKWSYAAESKAVEKYLRQSHAPLALPTAIGWLCGSGIDVNPESRDPQMLLIELRVAPAVRPAASSDNLTDQEITGISESPGTISPSDLRIRQAAPGSNGQNQRFLLSIDKLTQFVLREQNVRGHIIVVWLGAGWPPLTGPGFRPDTPEIQISILDRIADLSNDLRNAQLTLDAVASPDALRSAGLSKAYYDSLLAAVTAPSEASAAHLALPVLAIHSGGQVFDQNKNLAASIADCLANADSGYLLSFQSRPSTQPDEYRPLEVRVDRPGVTIRTTTGYYAQP